MLVVFIFLKGNVTFYGQSKTNKTIAFGLKNIQEYARGNKGFDEKQENIDFIKSNINGA